MADDVGKSRTFAATTNVLRACVHRDKTETMQEIVTEGNTQPLQQNFVIHSVDRSREVEQDKCSSVSSIDCIE